MNNQIIKLTLSGEPENNTVIFIAVKLMEKGIFAPYSMVRLLALIHLYGETMTVNELAELAVKKSIVFSHQVVLNYFSTLKNFGIIYKPKKTKRAIVASFLK